MLPALTLNDQLAAALRTEAQHARLSVSDVALNADLPALYVARRLSGEATISVEDLVALCEAIGVYPAVVLGQVLAGGAVPSRPPAVAAGQ